MIYKRKSEGRTNYKKRIGLLKSRKLRLVVRRSLKNIWAQLVQYYPDGDKVILSAHTNELKKYGWKSAKGNTPAAYLTGLLVGVKAKKKDIKEAILDMGFYRPVQGSIIYALLKGAIDAGLKIPHTPEIFPKEDRIKGKHITDYYNKHKEKFTKHNPENLQKEFEEVKSKILK